MQCLLGWFRHYCNILLKNVVDLVPEFTNIFTELKTQGGTK